MLGGYTVAAKRQWFGNKNQNGIVLVYNII